MEATLKTFVKRALTALVLAALPVTADAQNGFVPTEPERALLMRAGEIAQRQLSQQDVTQNTEVAEQELRAVMSEPDYSRARPLVRDMVRRILATILVVDLDPPGRCHEVLRLTEGIIERHEAALPGMDRADFVIQFVAGATCDEPSAARALAALVSRYPEALANFEDNSIVQAARYSTDIATLEYLVDGRWQPDDDVTDLSDLRLELTRLHVRNGNVERASEVAQSLVVSPAASIGAIIRLLVEKDFAPLIARDPQTFEFAALLDWQVNSVRTRAEAAPDNLRRQLDYADVLLLLDRKREALAFVDALLARANTADAAQAFQDQDDQLNWAHNTRATILDAMQSPEESLAALERGVEAANASGGDLVSQLLNRSHDLVRLGRSREALDALASFNPDNASPYGDMVALRVRTCALHQTGDIVGAQTSLNEMRARASDSVIQVYSATICTNDLESAARLYIQMLDDPIERGRVVISLQTFIQNEPAFEYDRQNAARINTLRERRDVRRAIERATERRSFPIRSPAY